jgi:hypothetical protein
LVRSGFSNSIPIPGSGPGQSMLWFRGADIRASACASASTSWRFHSEAPELWSNDILLTFFYDAGGEGAWMFWCRDYGCGAITKYIVCQKAAGSHSGTGLKHPISGWLDHIRPICILCHIGRTQMAFRTGYKSALPVGRVNREKTGKHPPTGTNVTRTHML